MGDCSQPAADRNLRTVGSSFVSLTWTCEDPLLEDSLGGRGQATGATSFCYMQTSALGVDFLGTGVANSFPSW
jgi:hypothetical protein